MTPFSPLGVVKAANLLTSLMSENCGPREAYTARGALALGHLAVHTSRKQPRTSPTSSENMAIGIFIGMSIFIKLTLVE